jgi:hypothetical protein
VSAIKSIIIYYYYCYYYLLLRIELHGSYRTIYHSKKLYEQYFCFRVPVIWNKINTINCSSAKTFKKHLSSSLFLSQ